MNIKNNACMWVLFLMSASVVQAMHSGVCEKCKEIKTSYREENKRVGALLKARQDRTPAPFDPDAFAVEQLVVSADTHFTEDMIYVHKEDRNEYDLESIGHVFRYTVAVLGVDAEIQLCKALVAGSFSERRIEKCRGEMEAEWQTNNPEEG